MNWSHSNSLNPYNRHSDWHKLEVYATKMSTYFRFHHRCIRTEIYKTGHYKSNRQTLNYVYEALQERAKQPNKIYRIVKFFQVRFTFDFYRSINIFLTTNRRRSRANASIPDGSDTPSTEKFSVIFLEFRGYKPI